MMRKILSLSLGQSLPACQDWADEKPATACANSSSAGNGLAVILLYAHFGRYPSLYVIIHFADEGKWLQPRIEHIKGRHTVTKK